MRQRHRAGAPESSLRTPVEAPRMNDVGPSVQRLRTSSGTLAYSRTGSGPPVLLIQGCGVAGSGWRPQIEGLRDRWSLIAFDNRGIGGSTLVAGAPLTIEAMRDDALAILDAERIERAHVVGHSMGGLIAQALALRAPARVRSLALLCTFSRGAEGARLSWDLTWLGLRSRVGTAAMRRAAFMRLVLPDAYLGSLPAGERTALAGRLAELFGHDLARQPRIALRQVRAMGRFDALARLPELASIPSLVVSAACDRIAPPRFGRGLAAAIPGSRFVEISGAGHALPILQADAINPRLAAFWSSCESGH